MKTILRLSIVSAVIALVTGASAASFTPGNIVVCRIGGDAAGNTGVTLTNRGNIVWLDEWQPLTDGSGAPTNLVRVQSILLRTNFFGAYSPLIGSGTAFANDLSNRSEDGRDILVGGSGV